MTRKLAVAAEAALIIAAGIFTGTLLAQVSTPDFHLARAPWQATQDATTTSNPSRTDLPPSRHESHAHFMGHTVNILPTRHATRNL